FSRDWSSDVCSSDLRPQPAANGRAGQRQRHAGGTDRDVGVISLGYAGRPQRGGRGNDVICGKPAAATLAEPARRLSNNARQKKTRSPLGANDRVNFGSLGKYRRNCLKTPETDNRTVHRPE